MKKILVLFMAFFLTSCSYIGATEEILISAPNYTTSLTVSSSNIPQSADSPPLDSQLPVEGRLILNTNSKKIHYYETCGYASQIKESNKAEANYAELNSLLSEGYSVCSRCEKQSEKN